MFSEVVETVLLGGIGLLLVLELFKLIRAVRRPEEDVCILKAEMRLRADKPAEPK